MRWRRTKAVVRWGCTVAAVAVAGAAVFCLFATARYLHVARDGKRAWGAAWLGGQFVFEEWRGYDMMGAFPPLGWSVDKRTSWSWGMTDPIGASPWRGGLLWDWPDRRVHICQAGVTLLYPFLLTAAPAAFLWYTHLRRTRPGQCASCRYDRRGLAPDAPCPECGRTEEFARS